MTRRLAVIGGGPAGLALAHWRRRRDPELEIDIYEAAPVPGGQLRTDTLEGYRCEWGPQSMRVDAGSEALLRSLGIDGAAVDVSALARRRWVGIGGRLEELPKGPLGLLFSGILPLRARLRVLSEILRPSGADRAPEDESLADCITRRFGAAAVPLAQAMARVACAGEADMLEVASAFPELRRMEREHRSLLRGVSRAESSSRILSFAGARGMSTLVDALVESLRGTETVRLHCDALVERLHRTADGWRLEVGVAHPSLSSLAPSSTLGGQGGRSVFADEVVCAVPAWEAAPMLRSLDPELAALLDSVPFAPVANVWLGGPRDTMRLPAGLGFSLSSTEPSPVLGALFASRITPSSAPPGAALVRVMIGGTSCPQVVGMDDAALIDAARAALRRYLHLGVKPSFAAVARIPRAIPQFVCGHAARVREIRHRAQRWPGLQLCGNSLDAVTLPAQLGEGGPVHTEFSLSQGLSAADPLLMSLRPDLKKRPQPGRASLR